MRQTGFIETANVRKLRAEVARAADRAAPEVSWVLIHGEAGTGKTATLAWLAGQLEGAYVCAPPIWTPAGMLADLAEALGVSSLQSSARALLGVVRAALRESPRPLIVDELDQAARRLDVIETLRHLSDTAGCIVIGAGGPHLAPALRRYPQIWSRVAAEVAYGALAAADVAEIVEACAELPVADGVAEKLAEIAAGKPRAVLARLGRAESLAKRQRSARIELKHLSPGASPAAEKPSRLEVVS